jgi:hypothetical protein
VRTGLGGDRRRRQTQGGVGMGEYRSHHLKTVHLLPLLFLFFLQKEKREGRRGRK